MKEITWMEKICKEKLLNLIGIVENLQRGRIYDNKRARGGGLCILLENIGDELCKVNFRNRLSHSETRTKTAINDR